MVVVVCGFLSTGLVPNLVPMIYITEVKMSHGDDGKHIEAVRWEHRGSPDETGESTVEEMVDWIENKDGFVHVRNRAGDDVRVHVVHPAVGDPFIRTNHDELERPDDLGNLPRYGVKPGEVA